jgi:hypothetical protein
MEMMMSHSLWTEEDQKTLNELVRKRGMSDVALGLRQIAYARAKTKAYESPKGDWLGIAGLLTRIYDNIKEGRAIDG